MNIVNLRDKGSPFNTIQQVKLIKNEAQEQINKLNFGKQEFLINPQKMYMKRSINDLLNQKSIDEMIPYTSKKVKPIQNSITIPSPKALDNFAQKFGFLPMGQIYQNPGSAYIGRRLARTQDGKLYYQQYNYNQQGFIQTPDEGKNTIFFATKAITKWNEYVKASSELQINLNKINMNRQNPQHFNNLAKTSSKGSSFYKIMSTLFHFYVKKSQNILYLTLTNQTRITQLLQKNGSLTQVYKKILTILQQELFNDKINFIKNYHKLKLRSFKASLDQSIYNGILSYLQDQNAYLTNQMIQIPIKNMPKWVDSFNKNQLNSSIFKTTQWNPTNQSFRSFNYLYF